MKHFIFDLGGVVNKQIDRELIKDEIIAPQEKYKDLYDEASNWWYEHWTDYLAIMIYNFNECDDEKCTEKNEYHEEYHKALNEFNEKNGFFGKGLMTEDENKRLREAENKLEPDAKVFIPYFMNELPEYKDIYDKYHKREKEIDEIKEYRKKRALEMFVEFFDDLRYWC